MATYILLLNFTEKGVRAVEDTIKRATTSKLWRRRWEQMSNRNFGGSAVTTSS
jgi:uncharacterized protein with GYD domain